VFRVRKRHRGVGNVDQRPGRVTLEMQLLRGSYVAHAVALSSQRPALRPPAVRSSALHRPAGVRGAPSPPPSRRLRRLHRHLHQSPPSSPPPYRHPRRLRPPRPPLPRHARPVPTTARRPIGRAVTRRETRGSAPRAARGHPRRGAQRSEREAAGSGSPDVPPRPRAAVR